MQRASVSVKEDAMKKPVATFAALAAMPLMAGVSMTELGDNVRVFSPKDDPAEIARVCEDVFKRQKGG